jgi:DNA polymerase-1
MVRGMGAAVAGLTAVIVAADRDLLQLVGECDDAGRVIMWDGTENYPCKVSGPPECFREMGVPPTKIADYFALVGGKNNIPGVKGIGPKAAVEILRELPLTAALAVAARKFGTVSHAGALGTNEKLYKKLKAGAEAARLSLTLATLRRDLPLDFPDILRRSLYQPT